MLTIVHEVGLKVKLHCSFRIALFKKAMPHIDGIDHSMNLNERINKRIKEGYKSDRKIRTDAVRVVDGVFGSSSKFFAGKSNEDILRFGHDFSDFLCEKVGRDNIVGLRLHMDEKAGKDENGKQLYSVHIHFQFVPITKDGKLNRKAFGLTQKGLGIWHSECAKFMQARGWELERGEERQPWQEPVKHEEPNEFKKKRYSENVESVRLEKILKKIDSIVEYSEHSFKLFGDKKPTAKLSKNDFKVLRDIAGEVVKLRHEVERLKPLEKDIEKMRERYAKKVKSLDDARKALEREQEAVANENEQRKYKRLNDELEKNLMQSDADKKEIADRLQQIKTNQKDAVEIADELIRKLPNELKGKWNSLDVHGQRVLGYLKKDCPELYSQLLRKSQQSILSEMNDRMEQKRSRSMGRSK